MAEEDSRVRTARRCMTQALNWSAEGAGSLTSHRPNGLAANLA